MPAAGVLRPLVVLVGRPNVGKSTLFNRLVGRRQAIVSSSRGTTRDRITGTLEWRGTRLTLMDTGGLEVAWREEGSPGHGGGGPRRGPEETPPPNGGDGEARGGPPPARRGPLRPEEMAAAVQGNVRRALQDADGFVLVCDAQEGLVPADAMIMERLRETGKPIMVAVNKSDRQLLVPPDVFSLGVRQAWAVSALHGRGIGELLDEMVARVPVTPAPPSDSFAPPACAVAIVGRQNVGKSSLVNALLKEERVLVTDVPGTTRDAIDTLLTVDGAAVRLIDTAGLRHRRKVRDPVDTFAMARTIEAIRRCDVALVVLDATQGVTRDDQRILSRVSDAGCGCVLVVNKWDLVSARGSPMAASRRATGGALAEAIRRAAPSAAFAPVLAVSAKTGLRVSESLECALRVHQAVQRRIDAAECLTLLKHAWRTQPPPRFRGRAIRLQLVQWLPGRPVRLQLTLSPVGWLSKPYQHYLLKRFFAHPSLSGVPVTLVLNGPALRPPK